jgi:hypothetical protein
MTKGIVTKVLYVEHNDNLYMLKTSCSAVSRFSRPTIARRAASWQQSSARGPRNARH